MTPSFHNSGLNNCNRMNFSVVSSHQVCGKFVDTFLHILSSGRHSVPPVLPILSLWLENTLESTVSQTLDSVCVLSLKDVFCLPGTQSLKNMLYSLPHFNISDERVN